MILGEESLTPEGEGREWAGKAEQQRAPTTRAVTQERERKEMSLGPPTSLTSELQERSSQKTVVLGTFVFLWRSQNPSALSELLKS